MELGTASILVQLLLIFVLVAVFTGRRHLRARREPRSQPPDSAAVPNSSASASASASALAFATQAAPELVDLPPMARRVPTAVAAQSLVAEELLPPCFADTCADWAQMDPVSGKAADARFSLSDWSAPTDRMALDHAPDPASLDWALQAPMSCTIAPQVRHCA